LLAILPPVSPTRSRRSRTAIRNTSPQAITLIAAGRDASAQINSPHAPDGDRGFGGGPGFESILSIRPGR